MNCKAQPLVSYRVIVDLISATATKAGLTVHCELDTNAYPKGRRVRSGDGRSQHRARCIPCRHPTSQCASAQVRPTPVSTTNGTDSTAALSITRRANAVRE